MAMRIHDYKINRNYMFYSIACEIWENFGNTYSFDRISLSALSLETKSLVPTPLCCRILWIVEGYMD